MLDMASLETTENESEGNAQTRTGRKHSLEIGLQRSRTMVERSFTSYAGMDPKRFVCAVGIVFSETSGDCLSETPYVEPHVRCCGRRRAISRHLPDQLKVGVSQCLGIPVKTFVAIHLTKKRGAICAKNTNTLFTQP